MSESRLHSEQRKGKRVKPQERLTGSTARNSVYDLDLLFDRFNDAKVAEGLAKSTLIKNRVIYLNFCRYLDTHQIERDIRNVDVDLVRDYIRWLMEDYTKFESHKYKPTSSKTKGLSARTAHDYVKIVRSFFAFLVEEGMTHLNPFEKVKNVKYTDKEITILSPSELKALLGAPNQRTYTGFRDYVLITLLIDSMMRINEAISLRVSDVDFSSHCITVRAEIAKTRKARLIPIQKHTINLLKELLTEGKDFNSDFIFLSNYGERLEPNHFRNQLKRNYNKKAGITKRVHPHLFRHTGATMFLEAGGDVRHLQMLLGHSDLRMVIRYTHLSNQSLINQHNSYSPLNAVIGKLNKERKVLR